jgi:hypothetical protein
MTDYIVLDVATAPLANAADFLDGEFAAPANYKDPDKIAAYVAEKQAEALGSSALDPDLCRLSGFITMHPRADIWIDAYATANDGDLEEHWLKELAKDLTNGWRLISYNGLRFDWPVLNARARYLGVKLSISLDRFKSPHVDLYAKLTNHGQLKGHSLGWWVKRHGWTDLCKPLDGKEEARVFETGRWSELEQSLRHDAEATRRLAVWMGVLPAETVSYAGLTDNQPESAELF